MPLPAEQTDAVAHRPGDSSPERRSATSRAASPRRSNVELPRRFRERHSAGQPHVGGVRAPVAATLEDSKRLAERFSERTRHDIATTLEESRQLAERWRARTAPSVARTLAESYDLARRFERGQLRPAEPYRPPLPQGRPLLPRTLDDSLAFAARRPTATTSASLADAKAAAARFGARSQAANARYNVSELVKGPLLRGPDAVVEEPQGPTLRTRGGTGPGAGGTKPLLIDEPVTFKNALWTEYPVVLVKQFEYIAYVEFVDIAAGGGYVWAVSSFHDVYVLRPGSSAFERADGAPAATRVAVLSDGSPVVVTPNHRIEIGRRAGEHWIDLSLYSSLAQPPVSAIDVGAGDAQDDYPYGQIAVTLMDGRVFSFQHGFVPVDGGITIAAIALARNGAPRTRSSDGAPLYTLWAVGDNGDLFVGPGWQYAEGFPIQVEALRSVPAPFAAADVGVDNQGVAFVSGSSGDAWQLDTFGNRWLDTRGKARAIAAGPDGSMWIVGQDGTIYNRGGRKLGFWEAGARSRPKPGGQTWCEFELAPDAVARAQDGINRFVEGGASVLRIAQVSADNYGNDTTKTITEEAVLLAAANLGVDVFVLFDLIRTNERVVPAHYYGLPFDDPQMIEWFKAAFLTFMTNVEGLLQGDPRGFEDVIRYIAIGSEVDVYLNSTTADQWNSWIEFYRKVGAYIRSLAPRVKIGCVLTLHYHAKDPVRCGTEAGAWGMHNDASCGKYLEMLNAASDYVGFTSYPSAVVTLDDPGSDVPIRIQQMLEISGDKPAIVEEFGYPTYDDKTKKALEAGWPGHAFPASFFSGYDAGEIAQATSVDLTFDAWDKAGLRLPLVVWFTAFEQHIEGDACQCTPYQVGKKSKDVCDAWGVCEPCLSTGQDNPACHPCGTLDGENTLGVDLGESLERFFGSCGLIRSNGDPKAGWDELVAQTAERRTPRGSGP